MEKYTLTTWTFYSNYNLPCLISSKIKTVLASYLLVFSFPPCHHFQFCAFSFPLTLKWSQENFFHSYFWELAENFWRKQQAKAQTSINMSKFLEVFPLRNYLPLFYTTFAVFQEKKKQALNLLSLEEFWKYVLII